MRKLGKTKARDPRQSPGFRTFGLLSLALAMATGMTAVPALSAGAKVTVGTDWPVYGANLANTRTAAGGPAPAQIGNLHMMWRDTFTDGDFTGTPIVGHGVVYVGSNGDEVRAIQAVPTSSHKAGAVLWATKVTGSVNASLATDGSTVFVPIAQTGRPQLVALDAATGALRWDTVLDSSTDASDYGSPVPVDERTGEVVLEGVSATSGDPASPLRGSVSALDAGTGAVIWKTYTVPPGFNGGAVWSTPAVDLSTGSVYVGTGNAYSGAAAPTTDSMMRLDLATGRILGWFQGTAGDVFSSSTPGLDFDFGASPNIMSVGGHTIVGEGQKSGSYTAVNPLDMKALWHTSVGAGSVVGGILGSTAFDPANGRIVGPESVPGYVWSLAGGTGKLTWLMPGGLDQAHLGPVSISNGVVYSVTSSGFLEAWNEGSGLPLDAFAINQLPASGSYVIGEGSGVAIADGLVIADLGSGQSTGIVAAFGTA